MATVVRFAVVPWTKAENLARSVRNDLSGKGAGTPERNQSLSDEVNSVPSPPRRLVLAGRSGAGELRVSSVLKIVSHKAMNF